MEKKKYHKGFTVGTYDMFHRGHLNLVMHAKEYCDYLIVGVHTDRWVERQKNHKPVITFEDRAAIVRAIRYVDEVLPNEGRSDLKAWERLHFDVVFIGDDWKGTPGWNQVEAELKTVGCDVVYLPHTGGVSSTEIRESIENKTNSTLAAQ